MISGFRPEVDMICALLGYYAATSGNLVRTFRENLSIQSSGIKNPKDTSPPVPLYIGLVPRGYTPALNRSVTEFLIGITSFLLYFLPCPSVQIILFLGLPALHAVILSRSSADLRPLPLFIVCCYLLPFSVLIFT